MRQPQVGNRPMTLGEWGLLGLLALVWGGSFFFNGVAVTRLPVLTIVATRVVIGGAILYLLLRARGERMPVERRVWVAFLGMGLLNNALPFSLLASGQRHVASGVASILIAATPLVTMVLAHFLTRDEKLTGRKLAGVASGLAGVAVMIGGDRLGGDLAAEAMILAAALSYALAAIYGRRLGGMGVSAMASATGQAACACLLLVPLAVVDRPWGLPAPGWGAVGAVLGLAVLSTALAYVIYFRLLATAGATNLLLVNFLVPVSAILLGTLFLGETLAPRHLAGMALIALGLAAMDGRAWEWARKVVGSA